MAPYKRDFEGDFDKSRLQHPKWKAVLSEGDSWFSYSDIVGRIDDPLDTGRPQDQRAWSLLRLERAGDEIMTILSGSQRAELRKLFARWPFDALLFSAGGNDIIGPDLLPLLREAPAGRAVSDFVAFGRFERRRRQIQDCYRELLDMLADAGQTTKVFVNSYDYVPPTGKKALGIHGPWVLPYLTARHIPKKFHVPIVTLLIDSFATAIDDVAAEPRGHRRLFRVETRGAVQGAWMDEIHPGPEGARRVARLFEAALKTEGIL